MIPKIIHYCWFGGNPLPELAQKCIESWKMYLPDYKIKEWNESNFDLNCCTYVKEAYEAKKWAFVSDYTIHWYDASWLDERMKRRRARSVKIRNTIDGKIGIRLSKIYMTGSYYWEWITTGKWSIIKQKLQSKGKLFK